MKVLVFSEKKIKHHSSTFSFYTVKRSEKDKTYYYSFKIFPRF